ncbi:MAG: tRNA 2-selenouridine(34) synthase MnmH, partial [Halieaceae bacterium]|nr:tRNA 2-selenouridine(34) synthase MnmH [Halieaceae bacterium]
QQWRNADLDGHRAWVAVLLEQYYDPMYEYQFSRREGERLFLGDRDAVVARAKRTP